MRGAIGAVGSGKHLIETELESVYKTAATSVVLLTGVALVIYIWVFEVTCMCFYAENDWLKRFTTIQICIFSTTVQIFNLSYLNTEKRTKTFIAYPCQTFRIRFLSHSSCFFHQSQIITNCITKLQVVLPHGHTLTSLVTKCLLGKKKASSTGLFIATSSHFVPALGNRTRQEMGGWMDRWVDR